MNRPIRRSLALLFLTLIATTPPATGQAPRAASRRVAFLVGINRYESRMFDPLQWAENDVDALAAAFRGLGFDRVVVMKGGDSGAARPTKANIEAGLRRALDGPDPAGGDRVTRDDVIVVVLCGHGQQLDVTKPDKTVHNDGFYCPVDAVANDPTSMVSISDLTDRVLNERGGKNLVIVDACRDGVVDRDRGVRSRGIQGQRVSLPEDTAILFSCRAGQKSDERDDLKHGVFSHCVLEAIRASEQTGRPLTWDAMVSTMKDGMAELIDPKVQEPIAAGAIGRVVLGTRSPSGSRPDRITSRASGITLKLIPAGEFLMGSSKEEDPGAYDSELPRHRVRITRPFYLGTTEVTQGQYRAVTGQSPSGFKGSDDLPVENVSWLDAVNFCNDLSRREGLPAYYAIAGAKVEVIDVKGTGYRLPTEAEWEYACRARSTTRFHFGDDEARLAEYGWFSANSGFKTHPVGQKPANAFGLHDMHGNVCEWCLDNYDAGYYKSTAGAFDPQGPSTATHRVLRGGGWSYDGGDCRSANRNGVLPEDRFSNLGFRVARVPSGG